MGYPLNGETDCRSVPRLLAGEADGASAVIDFGLGVRVHSRDDPVCPGSGRTGPPFVVGGQTLRSPQVASLSGEKAYMAVRLPSTLSVRLICTERPGRGWLRPCRLSAQTSNGSQPSSPRSRPCSSNNPHRTPLWPAAFYASRHAPCRP